VILNNMRSIDIAARYGGEEFAFILPRTELYEAQAVAERIRADIEAEQVSTDSGVLTVTVSIGLVGFPDEKIPNTSRLLEGADEALYRAKRGGKNRIECFRAPSESA
jgi:diguanylate cyclase (GGDEF)-like protein